LILDHLKSKTFTSLSNQSFCRLWVAAWFWYTCRWMEVAVLGWLVLELTNSPSQVVIVGIAQYFPMFLFGFFAGSVTDRFPKKKVMIVSQTTNFLTAFSMLLVISSGKVQAWHAFIYMFIVGINAAVDWSTRRAYYSELFDATQLANAMSLESVAYSGSSMLGPLLGGTITALLGYSGSYIVIFSMYLIGLILLFSIGNTQAIKAETPKGSGVSQLVSSIKTIRNTPIIWAVLMVTIPMNLFGFSYLNLLSVIARDVLGVGAALYGLLGSAAGMGAVIGALFIASRQIIKRNTLFSISSTLILGILFLFAWSPNYVLSLSLLFISGLAMSGFDTMQSTIVLNAAPPDIRGRAMGIIALGIGATPIGAWILGQLAEVIGPQPGLAIMTGTGFLILIFLRWRFPTLSDKNTE
jgi:MFS family permease